MSIVTIDDTNLTNIANSIRNKNGSTTKYKPSEMATAISNIETGSGGITPSGTLEITENGTYDVTEYASANVNVSGGGSEEDLLAMLLMNKLTELNNSNATSLRSRACQGATVLKTVNLPNVTSLGTYAFYGAGVETINLPKATSIPSSCFYTCTSMTMADLGAAKSIAGYGFYTCQSLKTLILRRSDAICTLSASTSLSNSGIALNKGYAYVPDDLVEEYKVATNWSTYADRIKPLSELEGE